MTPQEPHDSDLLPNQPKLSSRSTFRLAASLVTAIAVIVILNLTFALHLQTSMIDMRKQEIKRLVVLSLNVVEPILKRLEALLEQPDGLTCQHDCSFQFMRGKNWQYVTL